MNPSLLRTVLGLCCALTIMALPQIATAQSLSEDDAVSRLYKARAGDAQEQFLLGLMYQYSKGVAQSDKEAAHWYGEAAKQGHMQGQLNLGNMYDKGAGVEQSYSKALQWYFKAAKQGSAEAMYFIGSMTYNGDGTKPDPKIAMQWFKKSAEYGLAQGQMAYNEILTEMGGVPLEATISKADATPAKSPPSSSLTPPTNAASSQPSSNAQTGPNAQTGFAVQIGSFKTQEQAKSHWQKLRASKPEDFGNSVVNIFKKTFESGKVFYRLNAGMFAKRAEANSFCNRIKANGTDCLVVKY